MPLVTYKIAKTACDFEQGKQLFSEYANLFCPSLYTLTMENAFKSIVHTALYPKGMLILAHIGVSTSASIAGCIGLRHYDNSTAELIHKYVKNEYKQLCIGQELIKLAVQQAKLLGYEKVYTNILSAMTDIVALYRKLGFQLCKPHNLNSAKEVILMQKIIR